jgi:DNA primase
MTYTIDELKEELSIEDVLIECGAEIETSTGYGWRSEVPIFCPFHLNTNTAAASMNTLKQVFHCYSCGAGGSVIDAALLHLGPDTTIGEAASWLEMTFLS